MKFFALKLLALPLFFCAVSLQAEDTLVDRATGASFPREISFSADGKDYQLDITGVATRKKLVIKVYSIAHYLQKGAAQQAGNKLDAILSDKNAKQFTMKWSRDVDVGKVQGAFHEAFQKVFSGQQYSQVESQINQFTQFFNQEAHKGDEYVIRWIPGGTITVIINGKEAGHVQSPEFAKGLWNVWFGPDSVVNVNNLTSQLQ